MTGFVPEWVVDSNGWLEIVTEAVPGQSRHATMADVVQAERQDLFLRYAVGLGHAESSFESFDAYYSRVLQEVAEEGGPPFIMLDADSGWF